MPLSRLLLVATGGEQPPDLGGAVQVDRCATGEEALELLRENAGEIDLIVARLAPDDRQGFFQFVRAQDRKVEVALAVHREERAAAFAHLEAGYFVLIDLPLDPLELSAALAQAKKRSVQRRAAEVDAAIVASLEAPDAASAAPALFDSWFRALDFDSALLFVFDASRSNQLRLAESRAVRSAPPQLPWLEEFLASNHEPQIVETVAQHLPPRIAHESPLLIAPIRLAQHAVGAVVVTRTTPLFTLEDLARARPLLLSARLLLGVPHLQQTLLASDRLARLGQLTASVGHELRNPVAYVSDNTSYLADQLAQLARRAEGQGDEPGSTLLREMVRSAEDALEGASRMRELLRDVQGFASGDETTEVPLDLNECVRAAVRMTRVEVRGQVQVICRLDEELPVVGNLPRLTQIFVNLIINAAQALAGRRTNDGHIVLVSRRDGDRVIVEVSDNGPGIPSGVMPRIFDAFFTTKAPGEGTGLGLFLCKDIARQHGGSLCARSSPTRGATFTLEMPACVIEREETGAEGAETELDLPRLVSSIA